MCPVCLATAAVIAGSATGTGGLGAFIATKILRRKPRAPELTEAKEKSNGRSHN
jgi:hypothetical protein